MSVTTDETYYFLLPKHLLVGRGLEDLERSGHLTHWRLHLEQCRSLDQTVPTTFEYEHPDRPGEWIVRTATFVPRARGAVEIYIRHLGVRRTVD